MAAVDSAARTQVDHPVGSFDDVKIMLDNNDGVALIGEAVKDFEKLSERPSKSETCRGFVENVERLSGRTS